MNRFLKGKGDEGESFKKSEKVLVRKYDPEYIKYGSINAGADLKPKAQCVEYLNLVK